MTLQLLTLDQTETEAAMVLAKHVSIALRIPRVELECLALPGFHEAPAHIECFVRTPFPRDKLSRRYRNNARSAKEWQALGLRLDLTTFESFGWGRFLEELYFPLFARVAYERGISPHGILELDAVAKLASSGATLAIVSHDAQIAGAALLGPGVPFQQARAVRGVLPSGTWREGLVYALHDAYRGCRRALIVALAQAYGQLGYQWLSLGRDHAWCDAGYQAVMREKFHIADVIVCRFDAWHHMFSIHVSETDAVTLFGWDWMNEKIILKHYGPPSRHVAEIEALSLSQPRAAL